MAKVAGLEVDIGVDERNGVMRRAQREEPWACHQNQTVEGFQGGQQHGSDRQLVLEVGEMTSTQRH